MSFWKNDSDGNGQAGPSLNFWQKPAEDKPARPSLDFWQKPQPDPQRPDLDFWQQPPQEDPPKIIKVYKEGEEIIIDFDEMEGLDFETLGSVQIKQADGKVSPTAGEHFVQLQSRDAGAGQIAEFFGIETSDLSGIGGNPTIGSAMLITLYSHSNLGDLAFDWWFDGRESSFTTYNDFSFFVISDGMVEKLANHIDVGSQGDTGWQTKVVEGLTANGEITLGFGVMNARDPLVDAFLYIDNIHAGDAPEIPFWWGDPGPEPIQIVGSFWNLEAEMPG